MAVGPGGSLKRLPVSLETTIASTMAAKRPKRAFSTKTRSIGTGYQRKGRREKSAGKWWGGCVALNFRGFIEGKDGRFGSGTVAEVDTL
jgi:hypothetical protein